MNCWKSINITKEIGQTRLVLISSIIGILSFLLLYVPISLFHGTTQINDAGILPLLIGLIMLPSLHSFMNILPLFFMRKRIKIYFTSKVKWYPTFHYYTKTHLSKTESLLVGFAPTLLITIPGLAASFIFTDFYGYILIFTCIHIGITVIDFLFLQHVIKAPKKAFIQNVHDGFDILLKGN
ncbi:DUF3267 domain-containing protein [Oceanobacillus saliphilus]|uniref:DUF3267 domain-containing protein n=1 Tax=Oceanobacillus saliphilus TaxID=2925834 RepID=UPI00201DF8EC|nr:DUF3267 domain-containing protein [Oceanobacillus saliphilus]